MRGRVTAQGFCAAWLCVLAACAAAPKPGFIAEDSGSIHMDGGQGDGGTCAQGCVHGACMGGVCQCAKGYRGTACDLRGKSCKDILDGNPAAESGVYTVDPDGDVAELDVYCDMTTDGGGWTKILQYASAAYVPTADKVGDVTTADVPGFAKLGDAQINAIGGPGQRTYRLTGSRSAKHLFVRPMGTHNFSDLALSWGTLSANGVLLCLSTDVSTCVFNPSATGFIDSLALPGGTNDCDRYFTDEPWPVADGYTPNCYGIDAAKRCVNAGITCDTGHPMIQNFALWMR